MHLVCLSPQLPLIAPRGLIFTSEAGISAYLNLPNRPKAPAFCVGRQTAKRAESAGLETVFTAPDAENLIRQIIDQNPTAPLLHLRGQDSHGNIATTLTAAGIVTAEAIIYAQQPLPLPPHALRLLNSDRPVILPLFSARSAKLFLAATPRLSSLAVAALSAAVATAIPQDRGTKVVISPTPDAKGMLQTVLPLLTQPAFA
jgi:uroporphyrinogen-III synthase